MPLRPAGRKRAARRRSVIPRSRPALPRPANGTREWAPHGRPRRALSRPAGDPCGPAPQQLSHSPRASHASRIMPPAMTSPGLRDGGRPPGARPKEDHRRRASRHAAPQLSVRQGAAAIGSWRRPPPGGRCAGRGTPASAAHDSLPVQGPRAGEQFEPRMGRSLRRRGLPLHPPRAGPEAFRAWRQQRHKLSAFRSPLQRRHLSHVSVTLASGKARRRSGRGDDLRQGVVGWTWDAGERLERRGGADLLPF